MRQTVTPLLTERGTEEGGKRTCWKPCSWEGAETRPFIHHARLPLLQKCRPHSCDYPGKSHLSPDSWGRRCHLTFLGAAPEGQGPVTSFPSSASNTSAGLGRTLRNGPQPLLGEMGKPSSRGSFPTFLKTTQWERGCPNWQGLASQAGSHLALESSSSCTKEHLPCGGGGMAGEGCQRFKRPGVQRANQRALVRGVF